jgi:hypothetical protein
MPQHAHERRCRVPALSHLFGAPITRRGISSASQRYRESKGLNMFLKNKIICRLQYRGCTGTIGADGSRQFDCQADAGL